jgi:hypothetical protein
MGMFDYVRCDVPLPDGEQWGEQDLQTRDFEYGDIGASMTTYHITAEGRLLRLDREMEWIPPDEPVDTSSRSLIHLLASFGTEREVSRTWVDVEHHGYLRFYGSKTDPIQFRSDVLRWHEYKAKFTDGQLIEITLIKPEA